MMAQWVSHWPKASRYWDHISVPTSIKKRFLKTTIPSSLSLIYTKLTNPLIHCSSQTAQTAEVGAQDSVLEP